MIVSASENWTSRLGIDGAGEQGLLSSSSQMKHLLQIMSAGVLFMMGRVGGCLDGCGCRREEGMRGQWREQVHLIYHPFVS